jgi:hypothetical protein
VRRRLALAVLLAAVAACPGIPRPLEEPQVELRAAQVSVDEAALAAELAVVNPNHEALTVEAVDWELDVDDEPVARGRQEQRVDVAALAPAAVRLRGALSPAQVAALGGHVTLSGTVHLRAARGLVAAEFYGPVEAAAGAPAPRQATRASSAAR